MAWSTITADVSEEPLGIREFGSSKRSSVQVPPLAALPLVGVLAGAGAPQALSKRISTAAREKAIIRDRDGGLLSIKSPSEKIAKIGGTGLPATQEPLQARGAKALPHTIVQKCRQGEK